MTGRNKLDCQQRIEGRPKPQNPAYRLPKANHNEHPERDHQILRAEGKALALLTNKKCGISTKFNQ